MLTAPSIIGAICATVIAKGFLYWLGTKDIHPEEWVAAMIGIVESALVNEGILWVLSGLIGLTGLFLGPFLLSTGQRWVNTRSRKKSAGGFLDESDARKRRQSIADKLYPLQQEGMQLLMRKVDSNDAYNSWKKEIEDWYERTQNEIAGSLGPHEKVLFLSIRAPASALFVQPFDYMHQQDLQFFGAKYEKLHIIIGDLSARLR
jgi:hypothetical protein